MINDVKGCKDHHEIEIRRSREEKLLGSPRGSQVTPSYLLCKLMFSHENLIWYTSNYLSFHELYVASIQLWKINRNIPKCIPNNSMIWYFNSFSILKWMRVLWKCRAFVCWSVFIYEIHANFVITFQILQYEKKKHDICWSIHRHHVQCRPILFVRV